MAPPDPAECSRPEDVGKLAYDGEVDIWYECVRDRRRDVITWVIIPPVEGGGPGNRGGDA